MKSIMQELLRKEDMPSLAPLPPFFPSFAQDKGPGMCVHNESPKGMVLVLVNGRSRCVRMSSDDWAPHERRSNCGAVATRNAIMVKVHSSQHSYEYLSNNRPFKSSNPLSFSYPWPFVTLAWFLRYPNPYAQHVLSTDTIHQSLNPTTNRLTIVRLHLKRGKLPVWSKRFLSHISESWIVETTEVDLMAGRMETRMRNLDHKRVLYVEERGTWIGEKNGT